MITISKPDFYDDFICIADRCDFTCCQEWHIAVDEKTYKKWRKIKPPAGAEYWGDNLTDYVKKDEESCIIKFNNEHKCTMMNNKGLCRLVLEYGEGCLSKTCHVFPREKHEFYDEKGDVCYEEYSLMPCCPAVVDFLNSVKEYKVNTLQNSKLIINDNLDYNLYGENKNEVRLRNILVDIIKNDDHKIEEAILTCFYILLDAYEKEHDIERYIAQIDDKWINEIVRTIRKLDFDKDETLTECNEIYLDIIDNYRNEDMYSWILDETGNWAEEYTIKSNYDEKRFINLYKEYEQLLRVFITEEIYSDCLIPEGKIEDMIIKLQWVTMEFVAIRQLLLLSSVYGIDIKYKNVRDYIVVICRMMGYEEDDIYEYMEDSFEEIIWSFSYMALIIGRL